MAIEQREITALSIVDGLNVNLVAQTMQKIVQFQSIVHQALKDGHDFGVIPGTEKILMLMGLTSEYEIIEKIQNYETGFFAFTVKCTLSKGMAKVTEGFGHANTKEARYTNRWVTEKKIPEGIDKANLKTREKESKFKEGDFYMEYLIENSDGFTLANTVLKMAKKRSQVDATLTVASLSDLFTQDLEDLTPPGEPIKSTQAKQKSSNEVTWEEIPPITPTETMSTAKQQGKIHGEAKRLKWDERYLQSVLFKKYQTPHTKELTMKQASECIEGMVKLTPKVAQAEQAFDEMADQQVEEFKQEMEPMREPGE